MAFIKTEEVREIRKALKAEFPKVKFSVQKYHNIGVNVYVMATSEDELDFTNGDETYFQLNQYYLDREFQNCDNGEEKVKFFQRVLEIIKTAPANAEGGQEWFDRSDIQTDYFNIAFYINIGVGQWDKPYQFKG